MQCFTPLFSERLSLKLDETLNTLWGVKEDPHRTPKSQRKKYFREIFTPYFHRDLNPGPLVEAENQFSSASEMTNQFL